MTSQKPLLLGALCLIALLAGCGDKTSSAGSESTHHMSGSANGGGDFCGQLQAASDASLSADMKPAEAQSVLKSMPAVDSAPAEIAKDYTVFHKWYEMYADGVPSAEIGAWMNESGWVQAAGEVSRYCAMKSGATP